MFDPASLTLGQISSVARDFTIVGVLLTSAWKIRGVYENVKSFFSRLTAHMDIMENGMRTLLSNHLHHIEKDLKILSGRRDNDETNSTE
jgi:hypothetical protein